MTPEELIKTLEAHRKWIYGDSGGVDLVTKATDSVKLLGMVAALQACLANRITS